MQWICTKQIRRLPSPKPERSDQGSHPRLPFKGFLWLGSFTCWRQAGNETWNDPLKNHPSWWCPLFGHRSLSSFHVSFPSASAQITSVAHSEARAAEAPTENCQVAREDHQVLREHHQVARERKKKKKNKKHVKNKKRLAEAAGGMLGLEAIWTSEVGWDEFRSGFRVAFGFWLGPFEGVGWVLVLEKNVRCMSRCCPCV